ncbi:MAG: YiiD C-terminal domain-containing protein, partial [Roseimicrobium sp.]
MPASADAVLREAESFIHAQIPITRAMGVRVETYDAKGGRLVLTAPLEANHNHLGTAFGGSLSALCTLAGYALLWLELGDRHSHIVVRDSAIQYKHPVRAKVIRVECVRPEAAVM